MKTMGRRLERLSKKTGLTIHLQMYADHHLTYKRALTAAKSSFYSDIINSNGNNTRILFYTINNLLKPVDAASHWTSIAQCDSFLDFLSTKITDIHHQLNSVTSAYNCPSWTSTLDPPLSILSTFQPASVEEITRLIIKSNNSSCSLDPIPTILVKTCLLSISPSIASIINSSLLTSTVPTSLKTTSVTSILKKPGLDPNDHNNYRPISNLPFITKLLERTIAETALVKITNDLLLAADNGLSGCHWDH